MTEPDRTRLPIRRGAFKESRIEPSRAPSPIGTLSRTSDTPGRCSETLLVLIDDAGFGNPSTFGGPIQTPNYTRMAEQGLRYNRFHVTALCSPTRAALLTGRNNHAVGFGSVGEFAGGFPGYSATLPRDCAPLPRILRDNGYSTAAFGKWHLTPDGQQGPAGPFDRWPNGWGFDYFYVRLPRRRLGAMGYPCLIENQKVIGTPDGFYDDEDPYYFPDAMADKTIEWIHGVRAQDSDKPFFTYFVDRMQPRAASRRRVVGGQVQGAVRSGVGQAPRGDLRAAEEARCRPGGCGADGARRRVPGMGRRARHAQGVLRAPDGGVRRLLGERRLQRRSRDRCDRRARRARRHGDHLDLGRQRRQHGGHRHGLVQRDDDAERHPTDRRDAASSWPSASVAWTSGEPQTSPNRTTAPRGRGGEHPLQVGQTGWLAPGWHPEPHGDPLAGTDRGDRRAAFAVRPCDRCGSDDPRYRGHPAAEYGRRDRAGTDARSHPGRHLRRCERPRVPNAAVLRNDRQPRHVQGRMVARDEDRAHPLGRHARGIEALRAGRLGIRTRARPSSTTCRTTSRRPTIWLPRTPRRSRS